MIFDQLCGIVERHLPLLRRPVDESRLFVFEEADFGPDRVLEAIRDVGPGNFFLPFGRVAIEDDVSCVVLGDRRADQRGLDEPRDFVECLPGSSFLAACTDREKGEVRRVFGADFEDVAVVSAGSIGPMRVFQDERRWSLHLDLKWFCVASKDRMLLPARNFAPGAEREYVRTAGKNVITAVEQVFAFNRPDRFVVEVSNPSARAEARAGKGRKILRSGDRPTYTLLEPRRVRQVLGIAEHAAGEERAHPRPHERRRHFRTLRSERFKEARGRTVVVDACWVGPSEAVVGKRRYRVRLDL